MPSDAAGVAIVASVTAPTDAASERVADHLRAAILSGEFAPGERLLQEVLAERLGASRMPVREALRMLEVEGLVENQPNRGARVPELTAHEVEVIYRMRERLEPLALSESLRHLTGDDMARLTELQDRIEANSDVHEFLVLDREFHLLTYSGCDIDQLSTVVTRMWNSTQHHRREFMRSGGPRRWWVVNAEHRLLLEAMERRDDLDAQRILEGHIRRTRIELDRLAHGAPAAPDGSVGTGLHH
jgi:DNA-binding GntR family transcriptional regulator